MIRDDGAHVVRVVHASESKSPQINLPERGIPALTGGRNHNHYLPAPGLAGMQLGVVGLGRMGRIVADRAMDAGHDVVAFDVDESAVDSAAEAGATPALSLPELADELGEEKRVWLMVPAGDAVDAALDELAPHLDADDVVVDGGNSHFEDSTRRAESCEVAYLDCGTSGGPASAEEGFSLMVGGPEWAYDELVPVFDAVATGPDGHDRMGPAGSGHYVKMVHNGVEYALMQAYGEGFELLHEGRYDLDLEAVARTWNNGAVIRSWLLELCEEAFREEGSSLGTVADRIEGGSTGTWTVQEALEQEVPLPLIYAALAERFGSRSPDEGRFSRRLANRLRYGFGRHEVPRMEE
nr:decarboxylating 6-phosphogluconate dehydrogenase [Halomarina sp. BCD28]